MDIYVISQMESRTFNVKNCEEKKVNLMNEWLLFFYKHCCFYTVYKIKALCSKSVIVMKIKCSKTAPLFGAPWR